jgi:spermidine/putrescine transport system substrate-binding protein
MLRGALGGGVLLASGGALSGGLLAACGTPGTEQTAESCVSEDLSASERVVVFSNWPLYIDVDDATGARPTLEAFTEQTGIQVTYNEDVNDNNEFFGKVRNQLAACEPTGRDLFVLTDWLAARLVRLGWMQELDRSNLPNVEQNLLPSLRGRPWDPENQYAVPWQSGFTGIAYNGNVTEPVRSVNELLTREDLRGRVTLLAEMRDTMELMLLSDGVDPAEFTDAQFEAALDKLRSAVDSGQIRRFTGNDYAQDLASGDIAACFAWSGDVIQLQFDDEELQFVEPEEGLSLFSDNLQVPNSATHKTNAEELMNYYYDPEVAAEVAAWVNFITPVEGAQEAMKDIDPELADNPLIFPDEDTLARASNFKAVDEEQERSYEQQFQQVIGA